MNGVREIISKYPHSQRDKLIPILQDIQDALGYLPAESLALVANHLRIPEVKVYSVATFYNQFHFEPRGKYHIHICGGQGCHLEGGEQLQNELEKLLEIGEGEVSKDSLFSFDQVPCLGACHLAPALTVNGHLYGEMNSKMLNELLDGLRQD